MSAFPQFYSILMSNEPVFTRTQGVENVYVYVYIV